jgi:exodeoxyribonuclease VII small subunit
MTPSPSESPSFEEALSELERILRSLDDGATTLEESLSRYERGVSLLKHCYAQLRDAQQRIQMVAGIDPEGNPQLQPFQHSPSTEVAKTDEKRRNVRKPPEGGGLY